MDIKYIGGKDPEMVFYDEAGSEVEVRVCLTVNCQFVNPPHPHLPSSEYSSYSFQRMIS